jgi:hypothetical protein
MRETQLACAAGKEPSMDFNQSQSDGKAAEAAGPRQFIAIAGAALGVAIVIGWLMNRPGRLSRLWPGRTVPNADDIYIETAQQKAPGLAE